MFRNLYRWLKQIITVLIVLVVLVCFIEVSLRVYDSHTGQVTRCEMFDLGLLAKSRACHHELKPLLKLTIPATPERSEFDLLTNSLGARGPEVSIPKPVGQYRIICLGDERTAGLDVPDSETFCQRLQQFLQSQSDVQIAVINAGTPDYCPLLSALQFRQKLAALQPDLVLLNFDMSDVWDDYRYRRYTTMGENDEPLGCSHPLLDPPRQRDRRNSLDMFLLPQFTLRNCSQVWAGRVLPPPPKDIDSTTGKYVWLQDQPPDWSIYIQQTLSALVPTRDLCENLGGTFLVTLHPAPWQVATTASNGEGVRAAVGVGNGVIYRSRKPFQAIQTYCDEQEMWCADLSGAIQSDPLAVDLYQVDSANYSAAGHRAAARQIALFLVQNLQGPWRAASPRSRRTMTASRNDRDN
ncbi:MAG: hypothetical protein JWM11_3467 [Planctomycetaceae bacterium]|nr:hypothetical protein [Planctomycetaceae bacterium]